MKLALAASALALTLAGAPALAQEILQTGNGGVPPQTPVAAPATAQESDDAWARRTLDAATASAKPDAKPAASSSCMAAKPADNKPHGEVWAGIGTRGYRDVGGVVTQPLGACGTVTLMIDHAQSDGYRGGRAR